MKTDLYLVLTGHAYDITGTDEKPFELREPSRWIESRLYDKDGNEKPFKTVTIQRSYQKCAPRKTFEFKGIDTISMSVHYSFSNGLQFFAPAGTIIIKLGKQL